MFQLNLSSSNYSMKTYRIQEKRRTKASWIKGTKSPIKYLKASNPVELAEYVIGKRLYVEPDFKWWVIDVIRYRNRIIAKVKA